MFEANVYLQYLYTSGEKYFNCALSYLLKWTKPSSMQYLHFILSSSFSTIGGLLEWYQFAVDIKK
jgi:hypothetical protein